MKINIFLTRATIEVYRFLADFFFECRGSLAQNRRKQAIFFCVILVVHLGHGISSGNGFIFLQISFCLKRGLNVIMVISGVLVRLTTCKRLTNSLPKLSLITLSPPETAG